MSDDEDVGEFGDMFKDPEGFYPDPKPPRTEKVKINDEEFEINLLGEHHLWANYIWNASKCISKRIAKGEIDIKGKRTLELGAAGSLPSLMSLRRGSKYTVITDFPDEDLIQRIQSNVSGNVSDEVKKQNKCKIIPYRWGYDATELLKEINENEQTDVKYDVIFLSDLICNHNMHYNILNSCIQCGYPKKTKIYVSFTPHRPWLYHKDMKFFEIAKEKEFDVEILEEEKYPPMFEKDPGSEEMRSTVYNFLLTYNPSRPEPET